MSHDRLSKKASNSPTAADFPALRSFLRGYFHQDLQDEYGSAEQAARQFRSDASSEESAAVMHEWAAFLDRMKDQSLAEMNHVFTGPLGSSYALHADDVQKISAIFQKFRNKSTK
jgi:CdiI immunity protein